MIISFHILLSSFSFCMIKYILKVLGTNNLTSVHQVLEIIDEKARVLRSRKDTYSEFQAVDYT
jgi:hypothetical protein